MQLNLIKFLDRIIYVQHKSARLNRYQGDLKKTAV